MLSASSGGVALGVSDSHNRVCWWYRWCFATPVDVMGMVSLYHRCGIAVHSVAVSLLCIVLLCFCCAWRCCVFVVHSVAVCLLCVGGVQCYCDVLLALLLWFTLSNASQIESEMRCVWLRDSNWRTA